MAGVGRGRQSREGSSARMGEEERKGEERPELSALERGGKKENTAFLCRQLSMSAPEEQKISFFPHPHCKPSISVRGHTFPCPSRHSASPKARPGCDPWRPAGAGCCGCCLAGTTKAESPRFTHFTPQPHVLPSLLKHFATPERWMPPSRQAGTFWQRFSPPSPARSSPTIFGCNSPHPGTSGAT